MQVNTTAPNNWNALDHPSTDQDRSSAFFKRIEHELDNIAGPELERFITHASNSATTNQTSAVKEFLLSNVSSKFRSDMLNTLRQLYRFSPANPTNAFESSAWGRLADRLHLNRLPARDAHLDVDLYSFYSIACPQLCKIAHMANAAWQTGTPVSNNQRADMHTQLSDLESSLDVCSPGVIQHIADCYARIKETLLPKDLSTWYNSTKLEIARSYIQHTVQMLFHKDSLIQHNEIHMVAAFQNVLASDHGLPKLDDRYAAQNYAHDHPGALDHLDHILRRVLRPGPVCRTMAEQVLRDLQNALDTEVHLDAPPPFYKRIEQQLAKIRPSIGAINPHMVCDCDEEGLPIGLRSNGTLLAIELMHRLADRQHIPHRAELIPTTGPNTQIHHEHGLAWTATHWGEHCEYDLLTIDDLPDPSMHSPHTGFLNQWPMQTMAYEALCNHRADTTRYFQKVPHQAKSKHLQAIALYAACKNMGTEHPVLLHYADMLVRDIEQRDVARFLLSNEAGFLNDAQLDILLSTFPPAQCRLGTQGHGRSLQTAALKLDHRPEIDLPKATPRLFEKILSMAAQDDTLLARRYCIAWAKDPDASYLDIGRKIFPDEPCLQADRLIMPLLETAPSRSLTAIARLVSEIKDPNQVHGKRYPLLPGLIFANIPDAQCAHLLQTLLDKGADWRGEVFSPEDPLRSPTAMAFCAGKINSLLTLLRHPNTHIASNDHPVVWQLFCEMLLRCDSYTDQCRVVEALLQKGVALNLPEQHSSALLEVCTRSSHALNRFLIGRGCDHTAKDEQGRNALMLGIEHALPEYKLIELLSLDIPIVATHDGQNPIDQALHLNYVELATRMYRKTGGLNTLNETGYTPLHEAVREACQASDGMAFGRRKIKALVAAGANVNAKSSKAHIGKTALHMAYRAGAVDLVTLLLRLGANPYQLDNHLRSPSSLLRAKKNPPA
ncbi:MAG TPA: ankyrin repeat domain-containing protein [Limnobacter sp.]|nr:ankyrin repeat domain-containing protein [Limnobacter sp.]